MSADGKKSMTGTLLLVGLGVIAVFAGVKWLVLLVPAATLVWYSAKTRLDGGRN